MTSAYWCEIYFLVYSSQRGLGIVYPRLVGNAKTFMHGINDEFVTRAFYFA